MILPTDTVYGLHARVDDAQAIEVLKHIKERDDERYFITLISSWEQIRQCGIVVSDKHRLLLERIWP
jgi:tRNA A37 threonylcarbamoyladenosine synthetase subunit TsaC/SUA5/YrdC